MTAPALAPPFPCFGGKQRIADKIVAMLPEHSHYVEPYCGGLSVLLAKPRAGMETVNDLDGDLMLFWRVLRDKPVELARACALTPHARAEHALSRTRGDDLPDLERARRVWVAISQGRGGQLVRTGWRYYIDGNGSNYGMPEYLAAYVDRMALAAERLQHVSLENKPAVDIVDLYGAAESNLLYVDPPYLGNTRGHAHSYQHEMRRPEQHVELAEHLGMAKSAVVLSGYRSELYDDLYADWLRYDLPAYTNQGNHVEGGKGHTRTECVWSNRELNTHPMLDFEEEHHA